MSGIGERYECYVCHGTFTKARADEEAAAEMADLWTVTEDPQIVCDGCFQQVMAWAQAEAPEALRRQG